MTKKIEDGGPAYLSARNELRRIRSVRKIGIRKMAEEIGISPATLCRIEAGRTVSLEVAEKISPWVGLCVCCGARKSGGEA